MARDFRPKAARQAAPKSEKDDKRATETNGEKVKSTAASTSFTKDAEYRSERQLKQSDKKKKAEPKAESFEQSDDDEDSEDDETLLREIKALGGDEEDLKLISLSKGKSKRNDVKDNDEEVDPALNADLKAFVGGLDFKAAGIAAPFIAALAEAEGKQSRKAAEKAVRREERRLEEEKQKEKELKKLGKEAKEAQKPNKAEVEDEQVSGNDEVESLHFHKSQQGFVVVPTPDWSTIDVPVLPPPSLSSSSPSSTRTSGLPLGNADVERMHAKADEMLRSERSMYMQLTKGGKAAGVGPGMLSSSDARFIADLLGPGSRGGTLSDRIAALTLLAQTSPLHNFEALDTLLAMASKKGREESGKATSALANWLAGGSGLPNRKLRYFRDQPSLPQVIVLQHRDQVAHLKGKGRLAVDMHLVLAAFEDRLKRFYFDFLKVLETQSHDTIPFVRNQAIVHIFVLLKDKQEQEQNLLRLLVNKLGDSDRGVASKASSLLLRLLSTHPAMKAVVTEEVCNLVMRSPNATRWQVKGTPNAHAQYYGVLTLNQTMLTNNDEAVANRLVTLYFDLFQGLLKEMDHASGGKEDDGGKEEQEADGEKGVKRDKGRWRDGKRGRKGKPAAPLPNAAGSASVVQDADANIIAAILAGVRRALPFSNIEASLVEKQMDTLFRITHCSTFNISVQALQLIHQVCIAGHAKQRAAVATSSALQDRFYRALYASLLDPRLAKTSKQSMYLNLLFKALKSDMDDSRTKAFVKRLMQLLLNSPPPFVCGSLFLLGELFIAKPGLRAMLSDAEDEGTEHFQDVVDEEERGPDAIIGSDKLATFANAADGYDGMKREPRFARAELTCMWEMVPLLFHFHPSVALCAAQLLTAQRITTTADLNLHSLAHFLDRFVYRNPKKTVATSKGVSLMQPALHANSIEAGVMRLRGIGIRQDEFVNSDSFWRKKADDIPADQLFFHKFFNLRRAPADGGATREDNSEEEGSSTSGLNITPPLQGEREDDVDTADDEDVEDIQSASDDDDDASDSEMEQEIWKEMRRTMPRQEGDEMLDESDGDDELDADLMASSDDDEDDQIDDSIVDGEDDDGSADNFEEDEDDLLPFGIGSDDESSDTGAHEPTSAGQKRKAQGGALDGVDENGVIDDKESVEPKSKSQARREQRKKRKAMPTFATADAYAHLLGNSDDEEGGD